jgi:hypothetical protein
VLSAGRIYILALPEDCLCALVVEEHQPEVVGDVIGPESKVLVSSCPQRERALEIAVHLVSCFGCLGLRRWVGRALGFGDGAWLAERHFAALEVGVHAPHVVAIAHHDNAPFADVPQSLVHGQKVVVDTRASVGVVLSWEGFFFLVYFFFFCNSWNYTLIFCLFQK